MKTAKGDKMALNAVRVLMQREAGGKRRSVAEGGAGGAGKTEAQIKKVIEICWDGWRIVDREDGDDNKNRRSRSLFSK